MGCRPRRRCVIPDEKNTTRTSGIANGDPHAVAQCVGPKSLAWIVVSEIQTISRNFSPDFPQHFHLVEGHLRYVIGIRTRRWTGVGGKSKGLGLIWHANTPMIARGAAMRGEQSCGSARTTAGTASDGALAAYGGARCGGRVVLFRVLDVDLVGVAVHSEKTWRISIIDTKQCSRPCDNM